MEQSRNESIRPAPVPDKKKARIAPGLGWSLASSDLVATEDPFPVDPIFERCDAEQRQDGAVTDEQGGIDLGTDRKHECGCSDKAGDRR